MCTLTLVPLGTTRVRLGFNRDELRSRPAALPPQRRRFGDRTAILPIDPVSDGTWIAVNDAGLVAVLLNVNPPVRSTAAFGSPIVTCSRSRGTIIPFLLACGSMDEALDQLVGLAAQEYGRFRLILLEGSDVGEVVSDGERLWRKHRVTLTGPRLWTSSGLGDHLAEEPRRAHFLRCFTRPGDWAAQQDAFHRHRWPDEPHLSVCMRRADACTVSYTVLERDGAAAYMTYVPGPPDLSVPPALARLLFEQVGVL